MRFKLNLEGRVRIHHCASGGNGILGKEESMFQDTQVYFGPGDPCVHFSVPGNVGCF